MAALSDLWTISGHYCQGQWDKFLEVTDASPFTLWVPYTSLCFHATYWILGLIFMLLDLTKSFRKYKVQPGTNEKLDGALLWKVIAQVLFNQAVIGNIFIVNNYFISYKFNLILQHKILPTLLTIIVKILAAILLREIGFYYTHRLMHAGPLYKRIHKQHHEFTSPMAVVALYCHPVEHIICNMIPSALPIAVLQMHIVTTWIWIVFTLLETLVTHCGYHFPFFFSPEAHDFHHFKFNNCFGMIGLCDFLHGTDKVFRSSKAFARHKVLLGFKSAREVVPDEEEPKKSL